MADSHAIAEKALREILSQIASDVVPAQRPGLSLSVPEDLRAEGFGCVTFSIGEASAIRYATEVISQDLRLEHLSEVQVRELVHRFAIAACTNDKQSVNDFIEAHAKQPRDVDCFIEIEHLSISSELEIAGVRFVPPSDVPAPLLFGQPVEVSGVAVIPSTGTSFQRMIERSRVKATFAVRLLRAALRNHQTIPENQLRFKLGEHAWFAETHAGWQRHPDDPIELEMNQELADFVAAEEISKITSPPSNDIERRIHLAIDWYDRAQLELDPSVRVLFGFFALESVLGDRSEKLKGLGLAHRRAMLALAVSEGFASPERTFYFYDSIRSSAVHGEGVPPVSDQEARIFIWDVRRAIAEVFLFSRRESLETRKSVRRSLLEHPDHAKMEEHLKQENPANWEPYFSRDR